MDGSVDRHRCLSLLACVLLYQLLNVLNLRKIGNVALIRFVEIHAVPAALHLYLGSESVGASGISNTVSLCVRINVINAATHVNCVCF